MIIFVIASGIGGVFDVLKAQIPSWKMFYLHSPVRLTG